MANATTAILPRCSRDRRASACREPRLGERASRPGRGKSGCASRSAVVEQRGAMGPHEAGGRGTDGASEPGEADSHRRSSPAR